ncbi:hypothetical protein QQS21_001563 [Conoideocrella luteorostrata]|uniref:Uncharacterized protein n=1 Tax=Conoideocrella luteorostrata TaxID=1105319 RepID=A0AAJ0CWV8_9HYPO|nr:hypothetical protein QQS21_001563 [Conoideocrella luteorostrata]
MARREGFTSEVKVTDEVKTAISSWAVVPCNFFPCRRLPQYDVNGFSVPDMASADGHRVAIRNMALFIPVDSRALEASIATQWRLNDAPLPENEESRAQRQRETLVSLGHGAMGKAATSEAAGGRVTGWEATISTHRLGCTMKRRSKRSSWLRGSGFIKSPKLS